MADTKTPSNKDGVENKQLEQLDSINTIVGDFTEITNLIEDYSKSSMETIIAVTGYLYGDKIKMGDNADSIQQKMAKAFTTKIQAATAILLSGINKDGIKVIPVESEKESSNVTLTVAGVDSAALEALTKLVEYLSSMGVDAFNTTLINLCVGLSTLTKTLSNVSGANLDSVTEQLNSLYNILDSIDIISTSNILTNPPDISNIQNLSNYIDALKTVILSLNQLSKTKIKPKKIISNIDGLSLLINDISNKIDFSGFNEGMNDDIRIFDDFIKMLKNTIDNIVILGETDYKDALKTLSSEKRGIVAALKPFIEHLSSINFDNINENTVSAIVKVNEILSVIIDICKKAELANELIENIPDDLFDKIVDKINTIVKSFENLDTAALEANSEKLNSVAKIVNNIRDICIGVTLAGLFAIPALIGVTILSIVIIPLLYMIKFIINMVNKIVGDTEVFASLDGLAKLILQLGITMVICGVIGLIAVKLIPYILGFAILLTVFLTLLLIPLGILSFFNKDNKLGIIEGISKFVLSCTLVMIIGALFMMIPDLWKNALLFGAILAAFIFLILLPFMLFGKKLKFAVKGIDELSNLIITCTIVLIIGALFMMIPDLWKNALIFGGILALFIFLILLPFMLFGKKLKFAVKGLKALTVLIITCTLILIIGASLMYIPNFKENAIIFAILVVSFIGIIALVFGFLGKNITKGIVGMIGIMLIIIVATVCIEMGSKTIDTYGWEKPLIFAGLALGFILAVAGIAIALGSLMSSGVGALVFMAGIAALASIVLIISTVAEALKTFGESAEIFQNVANNGGIDKDALMSIVGVITELCIAISAIGANKDVSLKSIIKVSIMAKSMAIAISDISNVVADVASLKIPQYDNKGKITGYRQLTDADFALVSDNVGKIILAVGKAMVGVYNENPDMFKGLVFIKVMAFCERIGTIISSIAEGIKDFADLSIPIYKDGKIVGKEKIDINILTKQLEDNFERIMTATGGAMIRVWDNNKDFFTGVKFLKVLAFSDSIGSIISSIAKGIKDFADLYIYEYDKNGKPTGKKEKIILEEVIPKLNDNCSLILTSMASAINTAYENLTKGSLFKSINKPIEAANKIAGVVSTLCATIKDVADFRIDEYDADGKPTGNKKEIEIGTVVSKVNENVKKILETIPKAIVDAYTANEDAMDDVEDIAEDLNDAFIKINELINTTINCATAIAKAEIPSIDDITKKLNTLVRDIPLAFLNIYNEKVNNTNFVLGSYMHEDCYIWKNFNSGLTNIKKITDGYISIYNTLVDDLKDLKSTKNMMSVWKEFIVGLYDPFTKITNVEHTHETLKTASENVGALIKEVNNLNINKADKFIELTTKLSQLSFNLENVTEFFDVLNNKLDDTLQALGSKIEYAAKVMKLTDDTAEKRQKRIDANSKALKELLNNPLKVKLDATEELTDALSGTSSSGIMDESSKEQTSPISGISGGSISDQIQDKDKQEGGSEETVGTGQTITGGSQGQVDYRTLAANVGMISKTLQDILKRISGSAPTS